MSSIVYKNFPTIPNCIENKIMQLASNAHTLDSNLKISASDAIIKELKKATPEYTTNSLGVSFNAADNIYSEKICSFLFLDSFPELTEWVENHITKDYLSINIQVICNGHIVVPHIDEIRNVALNYIISQGGPSVSTCIYTPLKEFANYDIKPQMAFPFDRIRQIHNEVIPLRVWHNLAVGQIHSVEKIESQRIAVSISL